MTSNDQDALIEAVQLGPVSISADASWGPYGGGIFDGCSADPDIDHAIQLVGYNKENPEEAYWIVRNSWSESWGEDGYIRLRMYSSESQKKGTDYTPLDGSGCKGGPT